MELNHPNIHNPNSESVTRGRWWTGSLILWGLMLALITGADGEVIWRIIRVVIVIAATVGALWLAGRLPRWGAVISLVFGTIGLVIGIVFGFRYFMEDGLSWRVIAGIIDLAGGVVLLVIGGRRLISGWRRGWQIAAIPILVVVVAVVAWIVTPAVMATNVPPMHTGATPQDTGLTAQEVHFTTSDGVDLAAWYIPSTNRSGIVLRHGSGSTSSDVLAQAAVLAKHGYGVLMTDARGHGKSSGRAMEFGWYGDEDIEAAISFLTAQPDVDPQRIAVVGLSMGGEEALGAAADDSRIAAVVAEGATGRTDADKSWFAQEFGVMGRIQTWIEWAEYSLADLLTEASKPIAISEAAKAAAPRPILLIAAGEVEDEILAAKYIQQQAPLNVTVWTVPGAGHTQGLTVAPTEWENTVINFLDKALNN